MPSRGPDESGWAIRRLQRPSWIQVPKVDTDLESVKPKEASRWLEPGGRVRRCR